LQQLLLLLHSVVVQGYGEGTVVTALKRIGRATKFQVQFDGATDGELTTLKLKRGQDKAGEDFELVVRTSFDRII
jgi:hypothetical protein